MNFGKRILVVSLLFTYATLSVSAMKENREDSPVESISSAWGNYHKNSINNFIASKSMKALLVAKTPQEREQAQTIETIRKYIKSLKNPCTCSQSLSGCEPEETFIKHIKENIPDKTTGLKVAFFCSGRASREVTFICNLITAGYSFSDIFFIDRMYQESSTEVSDEGSISTGEFPSFKNDMESLFGLISPNTKLSFLGGSSDLVVQQIPKYGRAFKMWRDRNIKPDVDAIIVPEKDRILDACISFDIPKVAADDLKILLKLLKPNRFSYEAPEHENGKGVVTPAGLVKK